MRMQASSDKDVEATERLYHTRDTDIDLIVASDIRDGDCPSCIAGQLREGS